MNRSETSCFLPLRLNFSSILGRLRKYELNIRDGNDFLSVRGVLCCFAMKDSTLQTCVVSPIRSDGWTVCRWSDQMLESRRIRLYAGEVWSIISLSSRLLFSDFLLRFSVKFEDWSPAVLSIMTCRGIIRLWCEPQCVSAGSCCHSVCVCGDISLLSVLINGWTCQTKRPDRPRPLPLELSDQCVFVCWKEKRTHTHKVN